MLLEEGVNKAKLASFVGIGLEYQLAVDVDGHQVELVGEVLEYVSRKVCFIQGIFVQVRQIGDYERLELVSLLVACSLQYLYRVGHDVFVEGVEFFLL